MNVTLIYFHRRYLNHLSLIFPSCKVLPHGMDTLPRNICQGTARQYFDAYTAFDQAVENIPYGRYMVDAFGTGRVVDLKSGIAQQHHHSLPQVGNSEKGIPFGTFIMRELSQAGKYIGTVYEFRLALTLKSGKHFSVTNHRLLAIVSAAHGLTLHRPHDRVGKNIFHVLGMNIPDDFNYDRWFEYNTDTYVMTIAIQSDIKAGSAHAKQCDVDHRFGRDKLYLNTLLYAQATSHRMNQCFSYVRKNAGHWCFGLLDMKYVDGNNSSEVTESQALTIAKEGGLESVNDFDIITFLSGRNSRMDSSQWICAHMDPAAQQLEDGALLEDTANADAANAVETVEEAKEGESEEDKEETKDEENQGDAEEMESDAGGHVDFLPENEGDNETSTGKGTRRLFGMLVPLRNPHTYNRRRGLFGRRAAAGDNEEDEGDDAATDRRGRKRTFGIISRPFRRP